MSNRNSEILTEINRYLNNKMSNKERYEFERVLERDPFLADALEGMAGFRSSDIQKDLDAIDLISGKRKRKVRPVFYLSIAAGFLLVIVSIVFFKRDDKEDMNSAMNIKEEKMIVQPDSSLLAEQKDTSITDTIGTLLAEAKSVDQKKEEEKITEEPKRQRRIEQQPQKKEAKNESVKVETVAAVPQQTTLLKRTEPEVVESLSEVIIADENSDNNDLLSSGLINRPDLDTLITERSVVQTNEAVDGDVEIPVRRGVNDEARPLGGFDLYDTYLLRNLRYPTSVENQQREVVRLKFMVPVSGNPDKFTIIKAPDNKDFQIEAIRLVKEGPRWSPAVENGVPVEHEVSLRIIFKPQK